LDVVNQEFGCDFDRDGFVHRAVYDETKGQIVTDLVARSPQTICFPSGDTVHIARGEALRTEISAKYDRSTIDDLFVEAGLTVARWVEDELGFYALVLAAPD
jgi:L-histidine N-alpha-methyltransferase